MALVSLGIVLAPLLCFVRALAATTLPSDRCRVTGTWSTSMAFKDHLDFSFACAPESLRISFSGGSLDGEFFHFQRSTPKYQISTSKSTTRHRLANGSSNWTLTLSSIKGVQLIDKTGGKTLPVSLPNGQVGDCYEVQFKADTNIDFRFAHQEDSRPCSFTVTETTKATTTTAAAITTTTTTATTTTTTTTTTAATTTATTTATTMKTTFEAQPAPTRTTPVNKDLPPSAPPAASTDTASSPALFPSPDPDPDLGGAEVRSGEGRAGGDAAWAMLMAAVVALL
ncbi:cell wall protein DAN4-like [Penaeus chinensis]|uniref:cell wall protein DAN4-like n=1 Tax=Penaeus chinensis TaxID=139456 RepID=UPI001FB5FEC8|nr:cell wall protein DAN4-like [Penaeus chinensis]